MTVAALLLAAAAVIVVVVRGRLVLVKICGDSMAPTLRDGQRRLARRVRAVTRVARGQIVVFRVPLDRLAPGDLPLRVKRVAAVAGDPLPAWAAPFAAGDAAVPPGKLLVAGDNPRSQDSRHLGYIDARAIVAIARWLRAR